MKPEDIDKIKKIKYGNLIKDIRKETGLTAEKLAITTGIPKSTISKIATNQQKKGPTMNQILLITAASRYDLNRWLSSELDSNISSGSNNTHHALTLEEAELLLQFRKIRSSKLKSSLLHTLREITNAQR